MNTSEDRIDSLMGSFLALEHMILILCKEQNAEDLKNTIEALDLLRVELDQTRDINALSGAIPRKKVLAVYRSEMQTFENISNRLKGFLDTKQDSPPYG